MFSNLGVLLNQTKKAFCETQYKRKKKWSQNGNRILVGPQCEAKKSVLKF